MLARHEPAGVALLKIEAKGLKYCDPATSAQPELGAQVGLIGYVGGKLVRYTLNTGIVSSTSRSRGMWFQTDALLNYANSGGPVISDQGRLLGIALAPIQPHTVIGRVFTHGELTAWTVAPNSGVSMVCRIDRLLPSLADLKAGKNITRMPGGFLGVALDPREAFSERVVLGGVQPGSAAEAAGLKTGDRVSKVDGLPVASWKEFSEQISRRQPGTKVQLVVHRKNIVRHLVIAGRKVENEAELKALMEKLKPGEKFEGVLVQSNVRTVTVTLGEAQ